MASRNPLGLYTRSTPDWFAADLAICHVSQAVFSGALACGLVNDTVDGTMIYVFRLEVQFNRDAAFSVQVQKLSTYTPGATNISGAHYLDPRRGFAPGHAATNITAANPAFQLFSFTGMLSYYEIGDIAGGPCFILPSTFALTANGLLPGPTGMSFAAWYVPIIEKAPPGGATPQVP
jgi:hypothetical protein